MKRDFKAAKPYSSKRRAIANALSAVGAYAFQRGRRKVGPRRVLRAQTRGRFPAKSRTKTKKKKTNALICQGPGREAFFYLRHRGTVFNRKWDKTVAHCYYNQQTTNSLSFAQGRQNTTSPLFIFDSSQLAYLLSQLPTSANALHSYKVFIKKCVSNCLFSNASASDMELTVYHCLARRDGTGAPDALWTQGLATPYEGDTSTAPTGAAGMSGYWGSVPYKSELFNRFWKVKKTQRFLVGEGGNIRLTVSYAPNNFFPAAIESQSTYYAGWTYALLFAVRGGQVTTDDTTVSTCSGKMLWAMTSQCSVAHVPYNQTLFHNDTTLPSTGYVEKFFNEASGLLNTAMTTA